MKEGRGSASEDEVGEAETDRVLPAVYQRALGDILHLLSQPAPNIQLSHLSQLSQLTGQSPWT